MSAPYDGDLFTHPEAPGRDERTCTYRDDLGEWWWERPLTRDYTGWVNQHGPERCEWPHVERPTDRPLPRPEHLDRCAADIWVDLPAPGSLVPCVLRRGHPGDHLACVAVEDPEGPDLRLYSWGPSGLDYVVGEFTR